VDTHLAGTFFLLAALASLFSWLAKSHVITVMLYNGKEHLALRFGYLYEMNAGFFYLVVAPLFVISVTTVVRRLELALVHLATRGRLVVLDEHGMPRRGSPLAVIARCNRRIFSHAVLSIFVALPTLVVVGTEFMPVRRGDFWHVAFGYVQAPAIPVYNGTLAEIKAGGRRVNGIDAIPNGDYKQWKLEKVIGCPRSAPEMWAYWMFVGLALGVQVVFLAVVLWGLAKVLFVLWIVYIGLDRHLTGRPGMAVHLDFEDPASALACLR
jgi:hypothetical protein